MTFIDADLDGKSGVNFVKSKAAAKTGSGTSTGTAAKDGAGPAPASKASTGMSEKKQRELDAALSEQDALNAKYKTRLRSMEENGKLTYWSILFQAGM